MEDCLVFNHFLDQVGDENLQQVLEAYTEFRSVDDHAICDLAMYNYIEVTCQLFSHLNHIIAVNFHDAISLLINQYSMVINLLFCR